MVEKEKFDRDEVLQLLEIPNETLASYESELEIASSDDEDLSMFTNDEVESIKTLHKLIESGMTKNEIRILASFSEVIRNIDLEKTGGIKNLIALSPIHRLKQALNIARQEFESLKEKTKDLEEKFLREIESRAQADMQNISLSTELEAKEKTLESLDRKLAETLLQKAHLESQLAVPPEHKPAENGFKNKKTQELYDLLIQKDNEIKDLKKKNDELASENKKLKEENVDLSERLEYMEDDISEMEQEVEEKYQEQVKAIREQVEGLIESKQKEWDTYFVKSNEQQKSELLTLQRKHEEDIKLLNEKIEDQTIELSQYKSSKNPLNKIFGKK